MNLANMRAAVGGSGGVVRRTPTALLLVDTSTEVGLQLLSETSRNDGRELYDDLRRRAATGALPTLGALIEVDGDTIALLSGSISMTASTGLGSVEARPQGSGVYEQPLHSETAGVALKLSDATEDDPGSVISELLSFESGTIIGGGVTLTVESDSSVESLPVAGAAGAAVIGGAVSNPGVRASIGDPPDRAESMESVESPGPSSVEPAAPAAPPPASVEPAAAPDPVVPDPVAPDPAAPDPVAPDPAAPDQVAPAPAAVPVADAEPPAPEAGGKFTSIDLTAAPDAVGEPLPVEAPAVSPVGESDAAAVGESAQVLGVRCPVDHHNHPDAQYCSQCGRKMGVNRTVVLVQGPRPPLGLFVAEDGTTIQLNQDVVIGRDPNGHDSVVAGQASAVGLTDESLGLSRSHAMIILDDWDVTVRDLESANGTFLRRAGESNWEQLDSAESTMLRAGDMIKVPGYELQLELFHIAGSPAS